MANNKHSKKGRTTRRPTKTELERQKAIKRMLVSFAIAFVLLFRCPKIRDFWNNNLQFDSFTSGKLSLCSNRSGFSLSIFL